jgi:hypothetical protein
MQPLALKRAYEKAAPSDGARFLVERLWPRGIKKTDLRIEGWLKDVAQHCPAALVWARPGEMDGIPAPLFCRAGSKSRCMGAASGVRAQRPGYAHL